MLRFQTFQQRGIWFCYDLPVILRHAVSVSILFLHLLYNMEDSCLVYALTRHIKLRQNTVSLMKWPEVVPLITSLLFDYHESRVLSVIILVDCPGRDRTSQALLPLSSIGIARDSVFTLGLQRRHIGQYFRSTPLPHAIFVYYSSSSQIMANSTPVS